MVLMTCTWPGCPWALRATPRDRIADTNAAGAAHLEGAHRVGDPSPDAGGRELDAAEWAEWQYLDRLLRGRPLDE